MNGIKSPRRPLVRRVPGFLVDTLGIPIANRVEAANMSDRRAAARLLGSLATIFPTIKTGTADAGHQTASSQGSSKAEGYELRIVKRRSRASPSSCTSWTAAAARRASIGEYIQTTPYRPGAKSKSIVSSRSALSQSLQGGQLHPSTRVAQRPPRMFITPKKKQLIRYPRKYPRSRPSSLRSGKNNRTHDNQSRT